MSSIDKNRMITNNSNVFNDIIENGFEVGKKEKINVGSGTGKKELIVEYAINPSLEEIKTVSFNYFDRVVMDAICTIYEQKENISSKITFSYTEVLRTMSGDQSQKLTDNFRKAIDESVKKFASTLIIIDYTQEFKKRNNVKGAKAERFIYGKMLPVVETDKPDHYEIIAEMPCFTYAKEIGQINNIDSKYITCDKLKISNTKNWIMIKHFLARRFAIKKNANSVLSGKSKNDDIIINEGDVGMLSKFGNEFDVKNPDFPQNKFNSICKNIQALLDFYHEEGLTSDKWKVGWKVERNGKTARIKYPNKELEKAEQMKRK